MNADTRQRLDDLLPHLRPGSVALELHRIAAELVAAVRAMGAAGEQEGGRL